MVCDGIQGGSFKEQRAAIRQQAAADRAATSKSQKNYNNKTGNEKAKVDKSIDNAAQTVKNFGTGAAKKIKQSLFDSRKINSVSTNTGNEGKNLKGLAGLADQAEKGIRKAYNAGAAVNNAFVNAQETVVKTAYKARKAINDTEIDLVAKAAKNVNEQIASAKMIAKGVQTAGKKVASHIDETAKLAKNYGQAAKATVDKVADKAAEQASRALNFFKNA